MTRACDICKKFVTCNYCVKYGTNGIFIHLEKILIDKKKREEYISEIPKYNIDLINAAQYNLLYRFRRD